MACVVNMSYHSFFRRDYNPHWNLSWIWRTWRKLFSTLFSMNRLSSRVKRISISSLEYNILIYFKIFSILTKVRGLNIPLSSWTKLTIIQSIVVFSLRSSSLIIKILILSIVRLKARSERDRYRYHNSGVSTSIFLSFKEEDSDNPL